MAERGDELDDWITERGGISKIMSPALKIGRSPFGPGESYDQRLTRIRKERVENGKHPLLGQPLAGNGHKCGDCSRLTATGGHVRNYYKCDRIPITFGAKTDVRLSWPACVQWEAKHD